LWAEASGTDILTMILQLVLTIGKLERLLNFLPPAFSWCF
jgi:hypothetical protein